MGREIEMRNIKVNPVRSSRGALTPAGIVPRSNSAALKRGIISNRVKALPGEKIIRTTCHLCHGGCILIAHVKDGGLQYMEGDPKGPHNRGSICEKALAA